MIDSIGLVKVAHVDDGVNRFKKSKLQQSLRDRPAFEVNGMQMEGREWEYLSHVDAKPNKIKQKVSDDSCSILSNILDDNSTDDRNDLYKVNFKKANHVSQSPSNPHEMKKFLSKSPNTSTLDLIQKI